VSPRLRSIARNSCGAATRRAQRRDAKQPSSRRGELRRDTGKRRAPGAGPRERERNTERERERERERGREGEGEERRGGVSHGTNRGLKAAASENNCSLTGREMNLFNFR